MGKAVLSMFRLFSGLPRVFFPLTLLSLLHTCAQPQGGQESVDGLGPLLSPARQEYACPSEPFSQPV